MVTIDASSHLVYARLIKDLGEPKVKRAVRLPFAVCFKLSHKSPLFAQVSELTKAALVHGLHSCLESMPNNSIVLVS